MASLQRRSNPHDCLADFSVLALYAQPCLGISNNLHCLHVDSDNVERLLSEPATPHQGTPMSHSSDTSLIRPIGDADSACTFRCRIILTYPRNPKPFSEGLPHWRSESKTIYDFQAMTLGLIRMHGIDWRLHKVPNHLANVEHHICTRSPHIGPEVSPTEFAREYDSTARLQR